MALQSSQKTRNGSYIEQKMVMEDSQRECSVIIIVIILTEITPKIRAVKYFKNCHGLLLEIRNYTTKGISTNFCPTRFWPQTKHRISSGAISLYSVVNRNGFGVYTKHLLTHNLHQILCNACGLLLSVDLRFKNSITSVFSAVGVLIL